jgi:hypothetical protein
MRYQWGPWIEHDGRGCPVKGQWVQVRDGTGWESEPYRAHTLNTDCHVDGWDYATIPLDWWDARVTDYRVRHPCIEDMLPAETAEPREGELV